MDGTAGGRVLNSLDHVLLVEKDGGESSRSAPFVQANAHAPWSTNRAAGGSSEKQRKGMRRTKGTRHHAL